MLTSRTGALVVVLLVASAVAPVAGAAPTETPMNSSTCSNQVIYDAFRFGNETVQKAVNGSATVSARNTEVTVTQVPGFLQLSATNPNGYCVEFHVRLSSRIVSPAELGEVDSNSENVTAEWHAIRDFDRSETYTEVVFTLPAGSQATFAPSKLRVKSLAWTGTAKSAGGSIWERISDLDLGWGDDEDLKQRTYRFSAENTSETITVSLRDEKTGRTIEEWQAMYRTSNESGWRPVSTDSTEPVFYRQVSKYRVQFVFNDPDAQVRFTANPTLLDKANRQWDAWWAGTDAIQDVLEGLFD